MIVCAISIKMLTLHYVPLITPESRVHCLQTVQASDAEVLVLLVLRALSGAVVHAGDLMRPRAQGEQFWRKTLADSAFSIDFAAF